MLNLMSVLQQLSIKIKLSRVDHGYLQHPDCLVDIENDTKLRYSEPEYNSFMEDMRKYIRLVFFF